MGPRVPGGEAPPRRLSGPWSALGWFVVLTAVMMAWSLLRLPEFRSFRYFAFDDNGANLTAQALIDAGLRPVVDFGYHYGFLPLALGRLWFGAFGLTPDAYQALLVVLGLTTLGGLARALSALRVQGAGAWLFLAALPHAVMITYASLAQALEATFFAHALAEQARGRRGNALALMTACLFTRPSLAYVYGLVLLVLLVRQHRLSRSLLVALMPAVVVGLVLAATLGLVFGVVPVVGSLLPLTGARVYAAQGFGFFFGLGRHFWAPPGAGPGYYLGSVAGFWIASSLALLAACIASRTRHDGTPPGPGRELLWTCAVLHVVFVCLLFGNAFSWFYYSVVLVLGVAVMTQLGRRWAWIGLGLSALALLGHKTEVLDDLALWSTEALAPRVAGLWASREVGAEWAVVLERTRGRRPVYLGRDGAVELLFPGHFAPPVSLYLDPGLSSPGDLRRKAALLATAGQVVVAEASLPGPEPSRVWPEFREALQGLEPAWRGRHFRIYERDLDDNRPRQVIPRPARGE